MGQRASQPSGRAPAPQGRVRSANTPGTRSGNASPHPTSARALARPSSPRKRGTLALNQLPAGLALLGHRRRAICCPVPWSRPLELTEHFTSRLCAVLSQLRKHGGVSTMNVWPAIGLTFDTRSLSSGCDSEPNTESQGDLSCRRNKRTRLPRSVRLHYENRSGDRIW